MSKHVYYETLFLESKTGQQCVAYLESIQNTEIENKKAVELRYKYARDFTKEIGLQSALAYIDNMYIPYILFKKYNITVVADKSLGSINNCDIATSNQRKTAPTLAEGWLFYVFIMIGLSIFNERILWWIFTTIVFLIWRRNEIDKYN